MAFFQKWVTDNYQLGSNEIHPVAYDNSSVPVGGANYTASLQWRVDNQSFTADFIEEDLRRVAILWGGQSRPTAGDFVECAGNPDYYAAFHRRGEADRLEVYIWYQSEGVLLRTGRAVQSQEPPYTLHDTSIYDVIVTAPGSLREMVISGLVPGADEDVYLEIIESAEPWPGEWVVLEVAPP